MVENFSNLEVNKKTSKHKRPENMWLKNDLSTSHHSQDVEITKQTNNAESWMEKNANIPTEAETKCQLFSQQPKKTGNCGVIHSKNWKKAIVNQDCDTQPVIFWNNIYIFIYLLCLHMSVLACGCVHVCHSTCVDVKGRCVGAVPSFHHMGLGGWTQVMWLGNKALSLLN